MQRVARKSRGRGTSELKGMARRQRRPKVEAATTPARGPGRRMSAPTERGKRTEVTVRDLPIPNYRALTIPDVMEHLKGLSPSQLRKVKAYELKHKNRRGLMSELDRRLKH